MTPEEILNVLAIAPKGKTSLEVQSRCGSTVSMSSLASLWRIAHGMTVLGEEYRFYRAKLRQAGYAVSIPHPDGIRGANHKPVPVFSLTTEGKRVITKLEAELEKISRRINKKNATGHATADNNQPTQKNGN